MLKMFVYGTLKRGHGNNRLMMNSKFIGEATTSEKFALYRSGIPYVSSLEQLHQVHGELYEVPEEEVPRIDSLEGHPNWYERRQTEVVDKEGNTHTAWLYFCDIDPERASRLTLCEDGIY